jgi:rhodanese-related sulfurtransferase
MGNSQSIQKINYEDIQHVIKNSEVHILINTLPENNQDCLIPNTTNINQEEILINKFIKSGNKQIKIIIYGSNSNDEKIYVKYNQLTSLGFYNVFVYTGGLFEWLMLQDIYGEKEFPTTKKELDILKYKPNKVFGIQLLEY